MNARSHAAVVGALAAALWALQEPLDIRVAGCDYSDVAVLGKAFTRRGWWPLGFALHVANGSMLGIVVEAAQRQRPSRRLALAIPLLEHVSLYPLCILVDRYHPARGEPGVPPLARNGRAFLQATWRHLLFGVVVAGAGSLRRDAAR